MKISIIINLKFWRGMGTAEGKGRGGEGRGRQRHDLKQRTGLPLKCRAVKSP